MDTTSNTLIKCTATFRTHCIIPVCLHSRLPVISVHRDSCIPACDAVYPRTEAPTFQKNRSVKFLCRTVLNHEDGGSTFLRNIGTLLSDYTASHTGSNPIIRHRKDNKPNQFASLKQQSEQHCVLDYQYRAFCWWCSELVTDNARNEKYKTTNVLMRSSHVFLGLPNLLFLYDFLSCVWYSSPVFTISVRIYGTVGAAYYYHFGTRAFW
jgi:hypothetical protein